MNRSSSPIPRLALLLAFATGCQTCSAPAPPDQYTVDHLTDPYEKVPARGKVSDEERAAEVVDLVARQLNVGSAPMDVIKAPSSQSWRSLFITFLAVGDLVQVKGAWVMLAENLIQATSLPAETRVQIREAQSRIWDYENAKMDADFMKRAYITEIVWSLYVVRALAADAGKK